MHGRDPKTGRFLPGFTANPKGRPKGSRNRLGEAFLIDMHKAWEEEGAAVIRRVIEDRPQDFLRIIASLMPKDVNLTVNPLEEMSTADLLARLEQLSPVVERLRKEDSAGS